MAVPTKCKDKVLTDVTIEKPVLEPTGALSVETVLSVKHWNEHLFSFRISRPASFRFRSGEFVMIGLKGDNGKPLLRAYSVASPSWDEEIEFLSIKVQDGPLTSKLQLIQPGDQIYLGRKPTGTLVTDALLPGKRLFMLSTGTGLAPFLSLPRDPDVYEFYEQVVVVHSVRRVSDLAFRDEMEGKWAEDPLVSEQAAGQFHYVPTVTREEFPNNERIDKLVESGKLFEGIPGAAKFDPETDRIMMCGSMEMIKQFAAFFEEQGFTEGSNAAPGQFVIERAFVG
ncbi:ferredoxin--NADP reductase [Sphingobium yanoikuyae]|uniref:ferredoxin--NADP reductase n=1 Tax=Sphingobium yanoikuyae TaxID=13690 RepID=UPI0035C7F4D5